MIEASRKLSADSLLSLANTLPFGSFFPVVDGYVLPADVKSIFQNKQHNDVPVLAGWVTGDADLVLRDIQSPAQFKASAQTRYGNRSSEFLKLFPSEDEPSTKASQRKLALLQFAGYPARAWALSNQHNTYVYEFTYVPTDKPGFPNYGAFHTSEVPFALRTLKHWDRPWVEADRQVEAYMSSYWINFVKTSDPNGKGLPEWKRYQAASGNVQELGAISVAQPGKYAAEFEFLKSVNPKE